MKRILLFSPLVILLIFNSCSSGSSDQARLVTDKLSSSQPVSSLLYGHFYEHIYHSANGGLWGDLVWNRSFEEYMSRPEWKITGPVVTQGSLSTDVRLLFGDPAWTDYDFTLEARKDKGYEGFLILFRAAGEGDFYWLNLGGWGNSQHSIEKETGGHRVVATPFIKGNVADHEWVPIKVSVRGNHIEARMNNQVLYSYADTSGAILHGAVGIGSWSTAVSYRNLKVTSPDGKVLWEGLPKVPTQQKFPRHWAFSGDGTVKVDTAGPLNGHYYLTADPAGGSQTLTQEKFPARQGEMLNGSIWLKGSAGARVTIGLKTATAVVAGSAVIAPASDTWKEYPVTLAPQQTAPDATLFITVSGNGKVSIDQFSLMPENARQNGGFRPDLFEAVAAVGPTVIRWPGGCFAELYRWKDGIGPQHARMPFPVNIWDDRDVNSLGTDEYLELCRRLGSEPLLVINSGFHEGAGTPEAWEPWIREACEWVEYCNGPADSGWGAIRASNGHPEPYRVKFWEIDNELWRSRVPDPHKYSQAVKLFGAAMRKIDPTITIIAHGGNGTDMEWNQVVLDECAGNFDILSIHHYSDPDGYYTAALAQDSLYGKLRQAISKCSNPAIRVYVSEWNAQSTDWRTGLYAGNLLNIFERNSDIVTMGGPALFLRHITANAWDNAFINFNQTGWFPAPNYVVMKLWREHFAPARIGLSGIPDSVTAVATHDPAGPRLVVKLVNNSHSDKPIRVDLPAGFRAASAKGYLVRGSGLSDRNTMENPGNISPKDHPVETIPGRVSTTVPGLSCLLIEVK